MSSRLLLLQYTNQKRSFLFFKYHRTQFAEIKLTNRSSIDLISLLALLRDPARRDDPPSLRPPALARWTEAADNKLTRTHGLPSPEGGGLLAVRTPRGARQQRVVVASALLALRACFGIRGLLELATPGWSAAFPSTSTITATSTASSSGSIVSSVWDTTASMARVLAPKSSEDALAILDAHKDAVGGSVGGLGGRRGRRGGLAEPSVPPHGSGFGAHEPAQQEDRRRRHSCR